MFVRSSRCVSFAAACIAVLSMPAHSSAAGAGLQPGVWLIESRVRELDAPGVPALLAKTLARPTTVRHCLTAEEAAQGPERLLSAGRSGCRYTKLHLQDGKLDASFQCPGDTHAEMTGVYTQTSFRALNRLRTGASVAVVAEVTARRHGDCG